MYIPLDFDMNILQSKTLNPKVLYSAHHPKHQTPIPKPQTPIPSPHTPNLNPILQSLDPKP